MWSARVGSIPLRRRRDRDGRAPINLVLGNQAEQMFTAPPDLIDVVDLVRLEPVETEQLGEAYDRGHGRA